MSKSKVCVEKGKVDQWVLGGNVLLEEISPLTRLLLFRQFQEFSICFLKIIKWVTQVISVTSCLSSLFLRKVKYSFIVPDYSAWFFGYFSASYGTYFRISKRTLIGFSHFYSFWVDTSTALSCFGFGSILLAFILFNHTFVIFSHFR